MTELPWLVVTPDMRLVFVPGTRGEAATEGRVLRRATHLEVHQSPRHGFAWGDRRCPQCNFERRRLTNKQTDRAMLPEIDHTITREQYYAGRAGAGLTR